MKKAFITGISGQDGSFLAELLLDKGYQVHGMVRRSSSFNWQRIAHLSDDPHMPTRRINLHYGDMTDALNINRLMAEIKPDEVYNLAAQSHVAVSFETPEYTGQADGIGALRILEAIKSLGLAGKTRFYQASTSEMFGRVQTIPQTESTPFYPRSPYGAAKLYAHWITVNYREAYNLFAVSGILFNHESERRGENFVSRKITLSLARILSGKQDCLYLGNLDAKRDWGHAKDYVEGMWLMLQGGRPLDYVLATGEQHTVREFAEEAFSLCGLNLEWKCSGESEQGVDAVTGKALIKVDPRYFRPTEVETLLGDASLARKNLGWAPKVGFKGLVRMMVVSDLRLHGLDPQEIMNKTLTR
ncbi:MAG: GDP-mannose 4,6-dehydratase [Nitrospinota bacterium]|nr:GDP-mannose 4,6-dehydratase [Nitrospinota bacterium]